MTPVDRLYGEASSILRVLEGSEPSLAIAAADNMRKSLLLAAASYFELQVANAVVAFVERRSNHSAMVVQFVRNKAVKRQYHTWFNWEADNANAFFGLVGPEFSQFMTTRVKASEELKRSISAFMEVGRERNKMVHQDFASFPLDKTLDEIYETYGRALSFVNGLTEALDSCHTSLEAGHTA